MRNKNQLFLSLLLSLSFLFFSFLSFSFPFSLSGFSSHWQLFSPFSEMPTLQQKLPTFFLAKIANPFFLFVGGFYRAKGGVWAEQRKRGQHGVHAS